MAKNNIRRIGVVIEAGNIVENDANGKPVRENTKSYNLDGVDYFFSTGATCYDASSQKKVYSLSVNPALVRMIARGSEPHTFYVDDSIVSDDEAIEVAVENVKK